MSEFYTGVTFPRQKVTPSDDAVLRRAILGDSILSGCALSYAGSTLTMDPGLIIACGREFRHTSVQNWAVTGAASGYARLVLAIDTTRASTKEVFDQIVDRIEYAATLDGFLELQQDDINEAGTVYEVQICVVSLGAGGITGIVEQLGLNYRGITVGEIRAILTEHSLFSVYPIGSIYLSVANVSPASFLGGTWEQLNDRFLIGAGGSYAAGSVGGETAHTLTVAEMPSHKHVETLVNGAWAYDMVYDAGGNYDTYQGGSVNPSSLNPEDRGIYAETHATGGGAEHNNMPPYLAVYMWKRIA